MSTNPRRRAISFNGVNTYPVSHPVPARNSFPVEFLDHLAETVFRRPNDGDFPFGILFGIAGMRRVDHDGLAEFTADGARRGLGRIGGTEDVSDFANGFNALINDGDAF